MFKTFSKSDGGTPVNRESSQTRGGGTPSVDDIRDALNMPSSQGSAGSGGLSSGPTEEQRGAAEIQELKNTYIRELNQLGAALEQEGRKLEPDIDAAKKDIGRIQEVGDKLEKMGVDIKQEVNDMNLGR
jgi:outer membrane murein-binding lipoprotein Lpp